MTKFYLSTNGYDNLIVTTVKPEDRCKELTVERVNLLFHWSDREFTPEAAQAIQAINQSQTFNTCS